MKRILRRTASVCLTLLFVLGCVALDGTASTESTSEQEGIIIQNLYPDGGAGLVVISGGLVPTEDEIREIVANAIQREATLEPCDHTPTEPPTEEERLAAEEAWANYDDSHSFSISVTRIDDGMPVIQPMACGHNSYTWQQTTVTYQSNGDSHHFATLVYLYKCTYKDSNGNVCNDLDISTHSSLTLHNMSTTDLGHGSGTSHSFRKSCSLCGYSSTSSVFCPGGPSGGCIAINSIPVELAAE